jgi:hypothetical protein
MVEVAFQKKALLYGNLHKIFQASLEQEIVLGEVVPIHTALFSKVVTVI